MHSMVEPASMQQVALAASPEPSARRKPTPPQSAARWKSLLFLLGVTALAGVFRFALLDRPPFWNDEARTYMRICGTYDEMLRFLRVDGFGPLHYELDWLLAQRFKMTPFVMRLSPAVTGTLLVPAMYLLAFELLGRRVARLTAVLTACSAFFMAYSRDAKMYMPLWFFMTLHVGCLLWWMRTGRSTAWLACVAAGCAAVGIHVTGLIVLPLDLLIGMTGANFTWQRGVLLIIAVLLIAAGPIGYTAAFNRMDERIDQAGWGATGIDWVSGRTDGHDGAALTADAASGYLFAFSWLDEQKVRVITPPTIMACGAAMLALLAAAGTAALIPWRRASGDNAAAPQHRMQSWRAALWLSLWCGLPVYAFYRATVPMAATWNDWAHSLWQTVLEHHSYVWLILALLLSVGLTMYRRTRLALPIIAALLLVWAVTVPVAQAILLDSFSTVPPQRWLWTHPLVPMLAVVLMIVVAWTRSTQSPQRKLLAAMGFLGIVAIVLGLFETIDRAMAGVDVHPVWMPRYLGFIAPPLTIAAAALLLRLPFAALRSSVIGLLVAVNLAQAGAHLLVNTEPVVDKMAADVIRSMHSDGSVLAFTPNTSPEFGPNTAGSIVDYVGSYYLLIQGDQKITPIEFIRRQAIRDLFPLRLESDAASIFYAVKDEPRARTLLVWDGIDVGQKPGDEDILPRLGSNWRLTSVELYPVRMFLDWGTLYTNRRRVYVRP
jgi:uncharacterized membrane protein